MTHSNKPAVGGKAPLESPEQPSSKHVASFEVRYSQFLDPAGETPGPLPDFARDPKTLISLYRAMVLNRTFDKKAIALQRTGQLGTYASSLGQEATFVAVGSVMRPEDVLLPTYRESGTLFARGVTMTELLVYWGGDERGMNYAGPREDFPVCVPIASHVPHAVGVAYAMKLRRQARVAVCMLGDGATSKGDFYEALNLAGVWELPVVFVVCDNEWAISLPRRQQTRAQTLAQKAIAAGFEGEQVDGNDVIAVRYCMEAALDRARAGSGPSLVEAVSYRMSDHTTADDARRYRGEQEVAQHTKLDPIKRLHDYLVHGGHWNAQQEKALNGECVAQVDAAVKAYLETPAQPAETMFDYLYETLPTAFAGQRAELAGRRKKNA